MLTGRSELLFLFCAGGIYLTYGYFAVLQEEINLEQFGPDKVKFKNTMFLVFLQCVANAIVSWLTVVFLEVKVDKTPRTQYLWVALSYVTAMFCTNFSIQYVNYPTMVLAKCCKPIPVLIMGIFVLGKRQTWSKYVVVGLITLGIYIFTSAKSSSGGEKESSTFGLMLLVISLAMDGLTGPFQERLIHIYKPSHYHMMYFINWWASIILGIALIATGKGIEGVQFCINFPEILSKLLLFSITSAIGQNFMYLTIYSFGSLACSLVTTTRKFFTIFISVLMFGHPLSNTQWVGVGVVFAGLSIDIYNSSGKKSHGA